MLTRPTAWMQRAGALAAMILIVATPAAAAVEHWRGVASLPGLDLDFVVVFEGVDEDGARAATIDIPVQNVAGLALKDVRLTEEEIHFVLVPEGAPVPAEFTLTRQGGDVAEGYFTQAGAKFQVRMERVTEAEARRVGPPRPQTPEPPVPYESLEVSYVADDGVSRAGTLTIPRGEPPFPAVLLITGSGPQDRDQTLAGHKPFLVIADHLARRGVAALRVDDRGVGGSGGSTWDATAAVNVADVVAGVRFLAGLAEIAPEKVGLIGHSEGGWIAPLAAAESDDVAFIVLLAGPGVSGRELVSLQTDRIFQAAGASEATRRRINRTHERVLDLLEEPAPEAEIRAALRDLLTLQMPAADDAVIESNLEGQFEMMTSAWFRDVLTLDAREALRSVDCPVLALWGELDLQVPPDENLPAAAAALAASNASDIRLQVLPGLNHLFQVARTGLPNEYARIEQTFAPDALEVISGWITARFVDRP